VHARLANPHNTERFSVDGWRIERKLVLLLVENDGKWGLADAAGLI
jgi:hypothetical protein